MLAGPINQVPRKLVFTNVDDGTELEAQFNPTEFSEQLGAQWSTLNVLGGAFQQLQFQNTDNLKLRFELLFLAQTTKDFEAMQRARLLLLAWCYPRNVSNDIIGGAAPKVLVTWPGMLSLEAVLRTVQIRHQRFNAKGQSVHFTAQIELEEILNVQVHYDSVAEDNDVRFGNPLDFEEPIDEELGY